MLLVHLAVVAAIVGGRLAHAARVAVGDETEHFGAEQDASEADARATIEFSPTNLAVGTAAAWAAARQRGGESLPSPAFAGTLAQNQSMLRMFDPAHVDPDQLEHTRHLLALGFAYAAANKKGFVPSLSFTPPVAEDMPAEIDRKPTTLPTVQATSAEIWAMKLMGGLEGMPAAEGRLFAVGYNVGNSDPGSIVDSIVAPESDYVAFTPDLQLVENDIEQTTNKTMKPTLFVLDGSKLGRLISYEKGGASIVKALFRSDRSVTQFKVVHKPQVQKEVAADLWPKFLKNGVKFDGERTPHRESSRLVPTDRALAEFPDFFIDAISGQQSDHTPSMPFNVVCIEERSSDDA